MVKPLMWIELSIQTTADHAPFIESQLMLLGALAVTFQDAGDQPIYEPHLGEMPLWQQTIATGLFDSDIHLKAILTYLEQQQATGQIASFHCKHLANQDWERVCLDQFKPMLFGKRLWICPSWHTPPAPEAVNVILDPGLAFGTGTHPTTTLCLEWLDTHVSNETLVIDYGSGSGILSLAALKLGAKHVIAVDNDPQALIATKDNGARNELYPPQLQTQFPNELGEEQADLVIANILAKPLIFLASRFAELLKPNHPIVLSGILLDQVEDVKKAYAPWFTLNHLTQKGEWACLSGIRN